MTELSEQIGKAAVKYRNVGWNVIPLREYGKNPRSTTDVMPWYWENNQTNNWQEEPPEKPVDWVRHQGWKPLQNRLSTDEEFAKMFEPDDITGLGVITGRVSGLYVLDEDSYKEGKKITTPSPLLAESANGGRHHYRKYNPEVEQVGLKKGVFVEGKGQGGFIVISPSQVTRRDGTIGTYRWLKKCPLNKLPMVTEEDLLGISQEKTKFDRNEAIGREIGERQPTLLSLANSYWNDIILTRITEETGWAMFTAVNQTYKPPKEEKDLRQIWTSAEKFVKKNPPTGSEQTLPAEKTEPVYYSQLPDFKNTKFRPRLSTGSSKLDKIFDFPSGYYVIIANPGAGKGWFALWLTKNFFLHNDKKTVYFSLEMTEMTMRNRILQSWSGLTQEQFEKGYPTSQAEALMKQDILVVYPFGQDDEKYQTPENFKKDFEDFYEQGYRLFCFDHLHELAGANNNDTNQAVTEKWASCFRDICRKHEDVWLFVYAQPNGAAAQKKIIRREDIAGSKAITQKCDCVISLNRPVEIDSETHEIKVDTENRDVVIWVDKNRHGTIDKIGTKIYFSKTGNFVDSKFDEETREEVLPVPLTTSSQTKEFIDLKAEGKPVIIDDLKVEEL